MGTRGATGHGPTADLHDSATDVVGTALGRREILTNLAARVVPDLADWCAVDVRAEDGSLARLATVYQRAGRTYVSGEAPLRYSSDADAPGVHAVVRTGRSEHHAEVSEALLASLAPPGEGHLELLRELGPRSSMSVPVSLRERVAVVLSFALCGPGRAYGPADLALATDVARRASLAVENAELYERLAAERDQLRRLLERLPEGVITVTRGLEIQYANAQASHFLGRSAVRAGSPLPDPWPGSSLRELAAALFRSAENEQLDAHDPVTESIYRILGIPALDSDTALLVIADVTEQERRERAEREFVTNAAHELRTPLAAITTSIEVLQSGAKEHPDERDRFLGHIERESGRLARLGRALLVLARAQTGEAAAVEEVELAPVLSSVAAGLRVADEVALEVRCEPGLAIRANRDLAEQALANLAANAAKNTVRGRILFSASRRDDAVSIEVSDTGVGIAPAERDRVFDRFYRAGACDRDGFGLGLAIVRQAAEALRGTIELESSPGAGTTARLTLPAAERATP